MLTVHVEAMAGQDIAEAIEEMCVLASRLGCIVVAKLNDVHTMAKPGCDPRELFSQWEKVLGDNRIRYKCVCAQPIRLPRVWEISAEGKT